MHKITIKFNAILYFYKMISLRNIVFLLTLLIAAYSCNKENDTSIPVINILSPTENETFSASDTIAVIAKIVDERKITNIQVVLVNEDFTPISKSYFFHPNSNSYDLNMPYPLDDDIMQSGSYYILIKAENESKFKNAYRKIQIQEVPVALKKVLVVSGQGQQQIKISSIDSSQTISLLFDVDCIYAASSVSSLFQQFYLAGKNLIDLRTFSLSDSLVEWEIPKIIPSPIHNDNCLWFDDYIFATYNSQYIRGYDNNGSIIFTTNITTHDKPGALFRLNNYLIVDMQKQNSAGAPELVTYFIQSGIKMQSRQTQFKVSGFYKHSEKKIFISANNSGSGQLFMYNIEFDELEHLADLTEELVSSDIIDSDRILLCTENDIYIYDYSTLQLVLFMPDVETVNIRFEPLSSNLYLSSSLELRKYKFPQMILLNTFLFEDTIKNVHLLYNK